MNNGCIYTSHDGTSTCSRQAAVGNFCIFHLSTDHPGKPGAQDFISALKTLVENQDTNWEGFIFPAGSKLDALVFESDVDLRHARFGDLEIKSVELRGKFNMSHSVVNGILYLSNVKFCGEANFMKSLFNGDVSVNADFIGNASFLDCDFHGRAQFLGGFKGGGTFHLSRFHDAVTFRGARNINLRVGSAKLKLFSGFAATLSTSVDTTASGLASQLRRNVNRFLLNAKRSVVSFYRVISKCFLGLYKKYKNLLTNIFRRLNPNSNDSIRLRWLFESKIQMTEVEFRRPGGTKFIGVDLSKVSLVGTDMKGVHFYDVKFFQPSLGRQGLSDEVSVMESNDYNFRWYMWPRIESEYRNLRVSLEKNKDFAAASDFYVGEMEARRRQMPFWCRYLFSVEALYHALSGYGSKPALAVRMFIWLVLLHSVLTMAYVIEPEKAINLALGISSKFPIIENTFQTFMVYVVNSFKILTLQRGDPVLGVTHFSGQVLDTAFRVIGPIQLALIVLAIRIKIKRH